MLKPILEHLCSSLTILAYCLSVVLCTRLFFRFLSRIVGSLLSSLFSFQGPFQRPVSRAPDYNTTSQHPCQHFFSVFFNIFFGCCRTPANSTTYCIFAYRKRLRRQKKILLKAVHLHILCRAAQKFLRRPRQFFLRLPPQEPPEDSSPPFCLAPCRQSIQLLFFRFLKKPLF